MAIASRTYLCSWYLLARWGAAVFLAQLRLVLLYNLLELDAARHVEAAKQNRAFGEWSMATILHNAALHTVTLTVLQQFLINQRSVRPDPFLEKPCRPISFPLCPRARTYEQRQRLSAFSNNNVNHLELFRVLFIPGPGVFACKCVANKIQWLRT